MKTSGDGMVIGDGMGTEFENIAGMGGDGTTTWRVETMGMES